MSFHCYLGEGALSKGMPGPAVVLSVGREALPLVLDGRSVWVAPPCPCPSRALVASGHSQGQAVWLRWLMDLVIYLIFSLKFSLIFSCWLLKCFGYPFFHILSKIKMAIE